MPIYRVRVPITPLSINHIYGHRAIGRTVIKYMKKEGKTFKELCLTCLHPKGSPPMDGSLFMHISLYFGDKRKHDVDNYSKPVLDAFNKVLYNDDGQINLLIIDKHYDKEFPRVEVIVGHMDEMYNLDALDIIRPRTDGE